MCAEPHYAFRKRLNVVHQPGRCDAHARAARDETTVDDTWSIVVPQDADEIMAGAAMDLQDYFRVSMRIALPVRSVADPSAFLHGAKKCLMLAWKGDLPDMGRGLNVSRGFILRCNENMIVVCGCDSRGAAQGAYYIEDCMNLREAPMLKHTPGLRRDPLFSPRMVHSGWGLDQFPDTHLRAMAHAGFDAVLVFAKGVDQTAAGHMDFNDLADRAARIGMDLYFYSYLKSVKHPKDPGAREYYEGTYGALFEHCPRAKGVVLVGESCEFPSRDTVNTTGKLRTASTDGLRDPKPSPGWWPCYDYPDWLRMIKSVVREHNPAADVVFWTYNWGWAPESARVQLVKNLPRDVSLQVTFEMFQPIRRARATNIVMDYTISFPGPGDYFKSEARAAQKRNLRLYTMSNTGGLTWDFGVVPYIPAPFQWSRRFDALRQARRRWGLCGLMDSHHFGWYPSIVSEAAKWSFWTNSPKMPELLRRIAKRDFGVKAVPRVIGAWRAWSRAMNDYVPSNEDQYGPFRVGPSYPLIFHPDITRTMAPKEMAFPSAPHAYFGGRIVKTFYHPFENVQQTAGSLRVKSEIKSLRRMLVRWETGVARLEAAALLVPEHKRPAIMSMLGLGKFMRNCIVTAVHVKQWWFLNQKLLAADNQKTALKLLDNIMSLAGDELKNARDTIPLVDADSRLGWEPSMEYMTDRKCLEWKIRQVRGVLDHEIPDYRKILRV